MNYHLALSNLEYGGRWRYDGSIRIDAAVLAATNEIVLNAKDLDIQTAHIIQVGSLTSTLRTGPVPRAMHEPEHLQHTFSHPPSGILETMDSYAWSSLRRFLQGLWLLPSNSKAPSTTRWLGSTEQNTTPRRLLRRQQSVMGPIHTCW